MKEMILEILIYAAIGIAGGVLAYLLGRLLLALAKVKGFEHLKGALELLKATAAETAASLQERFVIEWKAANADHKLTDAEKARLAAMALDETLIKMSPAMIELIKAASIDVVQIVTDAVKAWVLKNHQQ